MRFCTRANIWRSTVSKLPIVPVDRYGRIHIDALREAICETSILISIMHANNETGTVQPIAEVAEIAAAHGLPLHTDAVQSVGKLPLDVQESGA